MVEQDGPSIEIDPGLTWVKSSASSTGTDPEKCVEVARTREHVLIRDSKHPGAWLSIPPAAWQGLLRHL